MTRLDEIVLAAYKAGIINFDEGHAIIASVTAMADEVCTEGPTAAGFRERFGTLACDTVRKMIWETN